MRVSGPCPLWGHVWRAEMSGELSATVGPELGAADGPELSATADTELSAADGPELSATAERGPGAAGLRTARRPFTGASLALCSRVGARVMALGFLVVLAHRQSPDLRLLRLFARAGLHGERDRRRRRRVLVGTAKWPAAVSTRRPPIARRCPSSSPPARSAAVGVALLGALLPGPVVSHWAVLWTALFIFLNRPVRRADRVVAGGRAAVVGGDAAALPRRLQLALGLAVVLGGYGLAALMAVLAIKQLLAVGVAQCWLPAPWGGGGRGLWRSFLRRGLWLGAATTLGVIAGGRAAGAGKLGRSTPGGALRRSLALPGTRDDDLRHRGLRPAAVDGRSALGEHDEVVQRRFLRRLLAITLLPRWRSRRC